MRVLILNQTFYPDVAATAQHMWDLAKHLEENGHEVHALASRIVYGGEQEIGPSCERIGGIHIHRVRGTAFGKKSLAGRMSDFLSFYASAWWGMRRLPRPDVILALTSPPMVAALALAHRKFSRRQDGRRPAVVYHVMDLYPDAAVAMGVLRESSLPHRLLARISRRTLRRSNAVIALGRDMADRLIARYGVQRERVHVITPWADGQELRPLPRSDNPMAERLGVRDTFNIVYSGNLGMGHDVETMSGAIEAMRNDPGIQWLFIGGGKRFDQLKKSAETAGWANVRFLPYQERALLGQSLGLADVHLVSQLPQFTGILVPSKLFGIMAAGRPSIMIGPAEAECSRIIADHGIGHVIPNGDTAALVSTLRQMKAAPAAVAAMGLLAREVFQREYDRPVTCGHIESLLKQVTGE